MDSSLWPQAGAENAAVVPQPAEKKPRPKEQALNCPRCSSTNTKFCYYNNYSLSQPRYFCKNCRRYWTEGGSLRNVPVGGGSRKNKRSSPSSSSASSSKKQAPDLNPPNLMIQNPRIQKGQDLNLAYNPHPFNGLSDFSVFPFGFDAKALKNTSSSLELLKPGENVGSMTSPFMGNAPVSSSVFFKPSSLGFSLGGLNQTRINEFGQSQEEGNGFWNGVLDGGSW